MLRGSLIVFVLFWPAAAAAQTPDARAAFTERLERLREITTEAVRLTPHVQLPLPGEPMAPAVEKAASTARDSEPRLRALLAEIDAMPKLAPINDAERNERIMSLQADARAAVASMAERVPALQQAAGPENTAQHGFLKKGWRIDLDAVRDTEVVLIQVFFLQLQTPDSLTSTAAFIDTFAARSALQKAAAGEIPPGEAIATLNTAKTRLSALAAKVSSNKDYHSTLLFIVEILGRGVAHLSKQKLDQEDMLATLLMLSDSTRNLIEAM